MKPKDKRELQAAGFIQGDRDDPEGTTCEQCGAKIRGTGTWLRVSVPPGDEKYWTYWCGPCARFLVEFRKQREAES